MYGTSAATSVARERARIKRFMSGLRGPDILPQKPSGKC
jgi:hypothetical protein